jgi:hypothetical protein
MVPKIKENLEIYGSFDFETSPIIYDKDFNPTRKITFEWCVEISQNITIEYGEDKIIEVFSEKLKQDFKKFIKPNI